MYQCEKSYYYNPLFEALFGKPTANYGSLAMKTDIYESEKAYRLEMEIPGVEKENLGVKYKDGYLTVTVKVPAKEQNEDADKLIRRERFYGETSREFYFGEIEEQQIDATYKDGVLTIVAPKVMPVETKPFKIEIH